MAFVTPLHLNMQRMFAVGPEDSTYIFDMTGNVDETTLAVSASNHAIKLYDMQTLTFTTQLLGHTAQISNIRFSRENPSILWSCAFDGNICSWDTRTKTRVAQFSFNRSREFSAMDINKGESLLAAGTQLEGSEARLCFWDLRNSQLLKVFSDVHNDDITQVAFHPTGEAILATGSTDGLVNVLDLNQGGLDEDECITTVCNSESSVSRIGFFGPNWEYLYCNTHIESFYSWNAAEGTKVLVIPDVRSAVSGIEVNYVIGTEFDPVSQRLFLICGSHSGNVEIVQVDQTALVPVMSLKDGHKEVVRCFHYNPQANALYTGGEDAKLCKWSTTPAVPPQRSSTFDHYSRKSQSPVARTQHKSTPY